MCPIIDVVDDDTLELKYDKGNPDAVVHSIGIFDWSLTVSILLEIQSEFERLKESVFSLV